MSNHSPDIPYGPWTELVDSYLSGGALDEEVAAALASFRERSPLDIGAAIDLDLAERYKSELAGFVVHVVQMALDDHALSEAEVHIVRHACRVLRIQEGDLLAHHRPAVVRLLAEELERLLEDDFIDSNEAIHKVRLQELLGLSYDEFVSLTAPQVETVLLRLLRRVDAALEPTDLAARAHWFRNRLSTLDAVYNLNPGGRRADRSGFVYLLVNPAMPGIVKVGKTTRVPETRMLELSGATGVPVPFELLFHVQVLDAHEAEIIVHRRLDELGTRVASNREFFQVPPTTVVEIMLDARETVGAFGVELTSDSGTGV